MWQRPEDSMQEVFHKNSNGSGSAVMSLGGGGLASSEKKSFIFNIT